jgi:N-methylhydantoinase A/oxoprolinase/acetone carboxylase beta subunit
VRIGIDVGGTHTDAVLLDGGRVAASSKALTSANVRDGVVAALDAVLGESGVSADRIAAVMIGTTQFTNAVIERRRLTPTAIIRIALPTGRLLPPMLDWPEDIAEALGRHCYMVHGGHTYDGHPLAPLDEAEIDAAIYDIAARGIDRIAIAGVFSPADAQQEKWVAARVRQKIPGARLTLSHTIGGLGLLERENAALLNASLLTLAAEVVQAFEAALAERGLGCPFYISQNDGTLMDAAFAAEFPALTFASGPTNSLRGASLLTARSDAVVVDIGGTTSDIGVLQGGFPRQSNVAIDVGGVRTNFRMPDIKAIGLGGGSLVADGGGRIGPQSVGYRLPSEGLIFGGDTLTATDIAVASGATRLGDPDRVAGLDPAVVERATGGMHRMIEEGVEQMKSSRAPVPVILVGGGSLLIHREIASAAELLRPQHAAVANAIGAANAQIGRELERIVPAAGGAREEAMARARERLTAELAAAGAQPDSIRVADVEETAISYLAEASSRLRIKMVGDLDLGGETA